MKLESGKSRADFWEDSSLRKCDGWNSGLMGRLATASAPIKDMNSFI